MVPMSPHSSVDCRHPATWVVDEPQPAGHMDLNNVIQEQIIPNANAVTGTMGVPDHILQVCTMPVLSHYLTSCHCMLA